MTYYELLLGMEEKMVNREPHGVTVQLGLTDPTLFNPTDKVTLLAEHDPMVPLKRRYDVHPSLIWGNSNLVRGAGGGGRQLCDGAEGSVAWVGGGLGTKASNSQNGSHFQLGGWLVCGAGMGILFVPLGGWGSGEGGES